jgi:hypothetical protein
MQVLCYCFGSLKICTFLTGYVPVLKSHKETPLEDLERLHPRLYDIDEKLTFTEGNYHKRIL